MTKQEQMRFDKVVDEAHAAFWQTVGGEYTEAVSGDISPDAAYLLERAIREALTDWTQANIPVAENKTTEILLHTIEYYYREADEALEMSESDIEHIAYSISQGISEGELNTLGDDEKEYRGWWEITK